MVLVGANLDIRPGGIGDHKDRPCNYDRTLMKYPGQAVSLASFPVSPEGRNPYPGVRMDGSKNSVTSQHGP